MSKTTTLDLYFCKQDGDALSYPSFGHIYVKAYGSSPRGQSGRSDYVLLTPECMTQAELDEQIDRLIRELEQIRTLGKKKFAKHK